MIIFFELIQQLILPSAFIPLIILFGALLTFRPKNLKIGRMIILFGLTLYYLFSITPVADIILTPLEKRYETLGVDQMQSADKIILLLGGRESDVLRASEVLRIVNLANQRIEIIISGTDPINPRSEEAAGVKRFFAARGIPAENISIEGRSRNTWENIRNVVEIIGDEPFFLVTSAYHMKRSLKEFEKVEANPIPAPTDFKIRRDYGISSYFPSARNLRNSDLAVHEYLGMLFYKLI